MTEHPKWRDLRDLKIPDDRSAGTNIWVTTKDGAVLRGTYSYCARLDPSHIDYDPDEDDQLDASTCWRLDNEEQSLMWPDDDCGWLADDDLGVIAWMPCNEPPAYIPGDPLERAA